MIPINMNGNTALKLLFEPISSIRSRKAVYPTKTDTSELKFYLASYPCYMFAFCNADTR